MSREVRDFMGNPRIFGGGSKGGGGEGKDCKISITEEEKTLLKLGPKFCMLRNLIEEEFEADLEECFVKIKWAMMGDEGDEGRKLEDITLEIALGKKVCQTIKEEKKEERDILEAETRMIFNWKIRTMNLAKRRATDLKGNSRVFFPREALSLKEESALETLRNIMMTTLRQYVEEHCRKKGEQKTNMAGGQAKGLRGG